jgi:hypothetical protein
VRIVSMHSSSSERRSPVAVNAFLAYRWSLGSFWKFGE